MITRIDMAHERQQVSGFHFPENECSAQSSFYPGVATKYVREEEKWANRSEDG